MPCRVRGSAGFRVCLGPIGGWGCGGWGCGALGLGVHNTPLHVAACTWGACEGRRPQSDVNLRNPLAHSSTCATPSPTTPRCMATCGRTHMRSTCGPQRQRQSDVNPRKLPTHPCTHTHPSSLTPTCGNTPLPPPLSAGSECSGCAHVHVVVRGECRVWT